MILLIRHGDYDESKTYKLTTSGLKQAEVTSKAITCLPGLPPIIRVFTSAMIRARETATIIARDIDPAMYPVVDEGLNEGDPSLDIERFLNAFEKYFINHDSSPKTEVIVCHANIIRCFVCR